MSIPTDGPASPAASGADEALRALAATALAAAAPTLLMRTDGQLLAANPAGRALLGARGAGDLAPILTRLAPTLRPGRAPRLERLRLPGRLTPTTFACSLITVEGGKALLMTSLELAPHRLAPGTEPQVRPAEDMLPAAATPSPSAPRPTPEPPALTFSFPLRFTWQTGADARLSHVDPRLASALGLPAESLRGRDWLALGAAVAHEAVLAGRSFSHLPITLTAPRGDAFAVELGGAPARDEGMRGFGVVRQRLDAVTPAAAMPAATAPVTPPVTATPATLPTSEAEPKPEASPAALTLRPPPPEVSPAPPEPVAPETLPVPAAPSAEPAVRVTLSVVPASPNVVPLRSAETARGDGARSSWDGLSNGERNAFREIARALGARLEGVDDELPTDPVAGEPGANDAEPADFLRMQDPETQLPASAPEVEPLPVAEPVGAPPMVAEPEPEPAPAPEPEGVRRVLAEGERPVLERLPLGVIATRGDRLLFANRTLLDWTGHADMAELEAAGGLVTLFGAPVPAETPDGSALALLDADGRSLPVEARLISAPWEGGTALVYLLRRLNPAQEERLRQAELALREAESISRELRAILDTATDGVVLIDAAGTVLSMNRPAEALFGFDAQDVQGENFTLLFAPESQRAAVDYLDGLASNGVASVLNDGREVIGRVREGGLIPLFMTVGRVGDDSSKFCAVLRDITQWKRAEEELTEAKRLAERANLAKSDFLAKISHEIRTPLNAIIGFSEVMMEERFGPIENQRYRDYLRDIHASGGHLISLINDLLDLSKIEAGKLDLAFTSVALNEIVQQSMAIMQPQANRERIIIRSSLAADLPPVVADARSIRQIVLNLVSNSIKFTKPGGQVILSTALTEGSEVVLRVRDTGIGMSEADIAVAMEPFRQLATSGRAGSGGTGLGLPLTKALAEANRANFHIRSAVDAGTLVEITFPSTRVLAE
ncbi:ATP-binding protein [Ancylobacter sp. A5.8]|uniref:PAS domain-containing sensor histidine kinase n=1 Tax=Ancylobacter gelatini TaxID=2919920 RepID=UPI001F4D8FB8|nr:PAS domain-containing sensor histidine kinase [Ancylobacter gelatini]MCJ8143743.1 ATP-binding protein [Ancylobacter gelatini]